MRVPKDLVPRVKTTPVWWWIRKKIQASGGRNQGSGTSFGCRGRASLGEQALGVDELPGPQGYRS